MEDGTPGDLDFAGNAGKGVFGAQAAHWRNLGKERLGPKRHEAVPWTCAPKLPTAPEALRERG
jgi:hypothetical protein